MYSIQYGAATDTGQRRDHNEDSYCIDISSGLFVISDGMGGHQAGEVASALAVNTIAEAVLAGHSLKRAVASAHEAILRASKKDPGVRGMGATAVALLLKGGNYEIAWVGDSRAYLWDSTGGELRQLSRDHSLVQQMLDSGTIKPEEARNHPKGNVVTQALGAFNMKELAVDTVKGKLYVGQSILICSDGLTSELNDSEIADYLRKNGTAQEITERLVDAANSCGGRDNITVILVMSYPEDPRMPEKGDTRAMGRGLLNRLVTKGKTPSIRNKILAGLIAGALLLALAVGYWML